MATHSEAQRKDYMDRGVQTEFSRGRSSPSLPSAEGLHLIGDQFLSPLDPALVLDLSGSPHPPFSTQFDNAYSHASPSYHPTDIGDVSPIQSISTTARVYKRLPLPNNRPSLVTHQNTRIASLPETISTYSARATVATVTTRVVSMPERYLSLHSPNSSPSMSSFDAHIDSVFVPEDERGSRVRVSSRTTDLPHTPSPPSSPESVLIIANKTSLPRGFLRNNPRVVESPVTPDVEGWITWARSPPRPIPALHGPLSLPYARCPSGAEGTILEEQDNLPGMIWGLEGEDTGNRSRSDSVPRVYTHVAPHKPSLGTKNHIPPRFQKPQSDIDPALLAQMQNLGIRRQDHLPNVLPQIDRQVQQSTNLRQHSSYDLGHSLHGQGPIDLSNIILQRSANAANGFSPEYDFSGSPSLDFMGLDLRTSDMHNQLGLDWQTVLLAQGRLRNSVIQANSRASEFGDDLRSTAVSPSVSSLQSLSATRSPIVLDSLSLSQSHQHSGPHRMSALEIAQKYRQQQLQQQQSLLPTPPNSSSPIWSSNFSPYAGSLFSPELVISSNIPQVTLDAVHGRQHMSPQPFHGSQPIHRSVHDRASPAVDNRKNHLAPAAYINHLQVSLSQSNPSSNYISESITSNQHAHTPGRKASSAVHVQRSPAPPGPPPNTPLPPVPSRDKGGQFSVMEAPPSPTSPKPRLRSLSHQHPRSIPLARLIQRRLSSVPEEDFGSVIEHGRSPSPDKPRMRSRTSHESQPSAPRLRNTSNTHFLSPPSSAYSTAGRPSPMVNLLAPQTKYFDIVAGGNDPSSRTDVAATVKLPVASGSAKHPGYRAGEVEGHHLQGNREKPSRGRENQRGRGQKKNGRGKRGRGAASAGNVHGMEKVDGGMMVRS